MSNVILNADTSVTLLGTTAGPGAMLCTIGEGGSSYVGTAFGGGGYFEAILKFNPQDVIDHINDTGGANWPAFWMMALEELIFAPIGDHWPGQVTGYENYMEWDIVEYESCVSVGVNTYTSTLHEWYGTGGGNNNASNDWDHSIHTVPANTDWNQYHKVAGLWVPATSTTNGYVSYYFDDVQVGPSVTWTQYTGQAPPPAWPSKTWTFGVLDQQHMALILGTGVGEPMTVQSVHVWQANASNNRKDGS
jgi:hypothetical protein